MPLFFPQAADARKDHTDAETPAKKTALQAKTHQYTKAEGHQTEAK